MVRSRAQHIYGAACERVDECLSLCMHPACPLKPYSVKHMMHSSCRVGHKVLRYAEVLGPAVSALCSNGSSSDNKL
eukprot:scaffold4063_cov21-Tisochrysis_lutea.AAC.3